MYRRIQLIAEESKEKEAKGFVTPTSGYKYKNTKGEDMVEYHGDSAKIWDKNLPKKQDLGVIYV
jgi:hypothetical protein